MARRWRFRLKLEAAERGGAHQRLLKTAARSLIVAALVAWIAIDTSMGSPAFGDPVTVTQGGVTYTATWTGVPGSDQTTFTIANAAGSTSPMSGFSFVINAPGVTITRLSGGSCAKAPTPGEGKCSEQINQSGSVTVTITTNEPLATGTTTGTLDIGIDGFFQGPVTVVLQTGPPTTTTPTSPATTSSVPPRKPCQCEQLTVMLDPNVLNTEQLSPKDLKFKIGFVWRMDCSGGAGHCSGEVSLAEAYTVKVSVTYDDEIFGASAKPARAVCEGNHCGGVTDGRFESTVNFSEPKPRLFASSHTPKTLLDSTVNLEVERVCSGTTTRDLFQVHVDKDGRLRSLRTLTEMQAAMDFLKSVGPVNSTEPTFRSQVGVWNGSTTDTQAQSAAAPLLAALNGVETQLNPIEVGYPPAALQVDTVRRAVLTLEGQLSQLANLQAIGVSAWIQRYDADLGALTQASNAARSALGLMPTRA